jgi:hypothetical protein
VYVCKKLPQACTPISFLSRIRPAVSHAPKEHLITCSSLPVTLRKTQWSDGSRRINYDQVVTRGAIGETRGELPSRPSLRSRPSTSGALIVVRHARAHIEREIHACTRAHTHAHTRTHTSSSTLPLRAFLLLSVSLSRIPFLQS